MVKAIVGANWVEEAIGHAMDAAVLMMKGETDKAMNIYN